MQNRAEWAGRVADLKELPPDTAQLLWKEWLAGYWEDRLGGVPKPFKEPEGAAMVGWVFVLSGALPEVLTKLERTSVDLPEDTRVFGELQQSTIVTESPSDAARLLRYLLRSARRVSWQCQDIEKLVQSLIAVKADPAILREIFEEMARLGCRVATELVERLTSEPPDAQ